MYYFGKDIKLKVFFFFFLEIILLMKQTTENIGKCFLNFFFLEMQPNTIKYFPKIILRIFYGETNTP
jgi:hypothetical protein